MDTYYGQKCTIYYDSSKSAEENYTLFVDEAGFPVGYKRVQFDAEMNISFVAEDVPLDEFTLSRDPEHLFNDIRIYTAPVAAVCPDSSSESESNGGSKSSGSTTTGSTSTGSTSASSTSIGCIQMVSNILLVVAFVFLLVLH